MKVPLLDLKAQFKDIREEVLTAIEGVCDDQSFILGQRVAPVSYTHLTLPTILLV